MSGIGDFIDYQKQQVDFLNVGEVAESIVNAAGQRIGQGCDAVVNKTSNVWSRFKQLGRKKPKKNQAVQGMQRAGQIVNQGVDRLTTDSITGFGGLRRASALGRWMLCKAASLLYKGTPEANLNNLANVNWSVLCNSKANATIAYSKLN